MFHFIVVMSSVLKMKLLLAALVFPKGSTQQMDPHVDLAQI